MAVGGGKRACGRWNTDWSPQQMIRLLLLFILLMFHSEPRKKCLKKNNNTHTYEYARLSNFRKIINVPQLEGKKIIKRWEYNLIQWIIIYGFYPFGILLLLLCYKLLYDVFTRVRRARVTCTERRLVLNIAVAVAAVAAAATATTAAAAASNKLLLYTHAHTLAHVHTATHKHTRTSWEWYDYY